jgi:Leu/Phe-tRNA-protein transferase
LADSISIADEVWNAMEHSTAATIYISYRQLKALTQIYSVAAWKEIEIEIGGAYGIRLHGRNILLRAPFEGELDISGGQSNGR